MVLLWTKLNPIHPRMFCAKLGWNWPHGSGEEDFLISLMYFRYFVILSPWKRVGPFILTKLNTLHPRMHCAKFGWNWPSGSVEDFKILSLCFRYFVIISPLKKGGVLHLNKFESPSPKDVCAKFGWNWPYSSWEEVENRKSLQTDRQTDDGWKVIRKAHLSFQLRWA